MDEGNYIFNSKEEESLKISSSIVLKKVNDTSIFHDFFRAQFEVYKNDKYWVPIFWKELKDFFYGDNPFWNHSKSILYVAYKNNRAVGRISGIIDTNYPMENNNKIGYFGFFECIKDFKVYSSLLDSVCKWLLKNNIDIIRGPINGRIDNGCGFLYQGFEEQPFVLSVYSPEYYIDFSKKYGMKKSRDLYVYHLDLKKPIPKYIKDAASRCESKGYIVRGFNKKILKREMDWWVDLMKEIFTTHWGYVNISKEEIRTRFGIKQARWIIDSGLFLVVEYNGEPIGFKWSLPDYNQIFKDMNGRLGLFGLITFILNKKKVNQGKFNFVGIKKEFRGQGIGSFMNYYTMKEMKKRGYVKAECGWIDEKNIASQRTIEKTGAIKYKKFRVYEKKI